MRLALALRVVAAAAVVAAAVACRRGPTAAERAAQARYQGRTMAEWWTLRRAPDEATATAAQLAMRALGGAGVPFLAAKAADNELGDVIGAGVALDDQCPAALPAMRAARATYPSPTLDAAIRRVQADSARRAAAPACHLPADGSRP